MNRKLKQKAFRFSKEILDKLAFVKEKGNYASETVVVEKGIELLHESLEKPKATLDLILQTVLGDELYQRHLDFLKKEKQEGENLEDVFRRFIETEGIQITKEEFIERVKEGTKVNHFKILDPSPCHYRAITEEGEWYCDTKKIPPAVCIKRQGRFEHMGRRCRPIAQKRAPAPKGRRITIPQTTYCYVNKENVSIREVCYNPEDPCVKRTYCKSLDHYKKQLEKARLRGQI